VLGSTNHVQAHAGINTCIYLHVMPLCSYLPTSCYVRLIDLMILIVGNDQTDDAYGLFEPDVQQTILDGTYIP
jgi:hypothetical protein